MAMLLEQIRRASASCRELQTASEISSGTLKDQLGLFGYRHRRPRERSDQAAAVAAPESGAGADSRGPDRQGVRHHEKLADAARASFRATTKGYDEFVPETW